MKTVIIGNTTLDLDYSQLVDTADHVVRFNVVRGYEANAGTKTDCIVITNSGLDGVPVIEKLLSQAVFEQEPYISKCHILLAGKRLFYNLRYQEYRPKPNHKLFLRED